MLLWPIVIISGLFLFFGVYLYFSQHKMVFFPGKDLILTPNQIGLEYEDLYLESGDKEKINAWFLPSKDSVEIADRKVVLFCHGNAGNISHRMETVEYILGLNTSIMLFDYRGFGKSEGAPGEEEVYQDALVCYNWLIDKKNFSPDQIIIFGRSLGGAVAVDLASKVPSGGVIVESSFTSAKAMAKEMFPIFPINLILKYKLNSIDKISNVKCPVLVTHSSEDDLIPYKMGVELFNAAGKPRKFIILSGSHNERYYLNDSNYRNALIEMINGNYSDW
jgi:uncharacterized protein